MSDIEDDLRDALTSAIGQQETCMVTRWIVLAETVDDQGERGMWTVTNPDAKAWDTLGLLAYGTELQRAQIVAAQLNGD